MGGVKFTVKERSYITRHLRQLWTWSKTRKEARERAKVGKMGYLCNDCGAVVPKVDIDHREPVGAAPGSRNASEDLTWDCYMSRLFCEINNLRALCVPCHKKKTAADRKKK